MIRQEAVLFHNTRENTLTMYSDVRDNKLIEMLKRLGTGYHFLTVTI